jgi:serine protease Do
MRRASWFVGSLVVSMLALGASHASAQELTAARRVRLARTLAASTVSLRLPRGSTASGFVVGTERWIATNYHVIESIIDLPAARVRVRFRSGTELSAHVIDADSGVDLALLEIDGGHVPAPPLELGDSDRVAVGQRVLAMGDPFGLEGTLTEGVVSARRDLHRTRHGQRTRQFIQTDAAGGPGSSGGPLVDGRGRVIGVTTLGRDDVLGIAYATPANYVQDLLDRVRASRLSGPRRNPTPPSP